MDRFVCIHGHFYQPPRENPWLEAIELQDSAYPYHDWNERITAECYGPNALARMLDAEDKIHRIVNNYARISFNFGPTLLSWMQVHAREVYDAVLEADRESTTLFGHGSAIAQAYNHAILPLSSVRDKRTQIVWGIADFTHRFGRAPEGMWLPETAVDLESLDLLAEHGIAFTILAPRQAKAIRRLGSTEWHEVGGSRIDPSRAYRVPLPSGRSIAVFFYDGPISQGVAFEGLLHKGEHLAHRLLGAFAPGRAHAQLAHIATDGETYGHHHKRGEMALAYALHYIEEQKLARLTNYGQFLELHPPQFEAQIFENSSWSCVHGIERWRSDCGCNTGRAGWNQAWRGPLRNALDWLRDELARRYEERASRLFRSAWGARDAYVKVVLDRSSASMRAFFDEQASHPLTDAERITALRLLEMQRHAMLMYTSCGWFFDEISGLEATQVLQYAGRALELGEMLSGDELEPPFLRLLERAKSNTSEFRDGRVVYERAVRPARVDLPKVVAHYAMTSLFEDYPAVGNVHAYRVDRTAEKTFEAGTTKVLVGQATVTSTITTETAELLFGVLYFGDHNLHGGVRSLRMKDDYHLLISDLEEPFATSDLPAIVRRMDRHFGALSYSLRSLFRDEQRKITSLVLEPTIEEAEEVYRQLYERNAPLMRFLAGIGVPLPRAFLVTSEFALNGQLRWALDWEELDVTKIRTLLAEAKTARVPLDAPTLEYTLRQSLRLLSQKFARAPLDRNAIERLEAGVDVVRLVPFHVSLWEVQNAYYRVLRGAYPTERMRAERGDPEAELWRAAFVALGEKLRVRV
jgi:alpha-amylase/alpha-mannosidase (GH57 family)